MPFGVLFMIVGVAAMVSAWEAESVAARVGIGGVGVFSLSIGAAIVLARWPKVASVAGTWLGWLPGAGWLAVGASLWVEWDALGVGGRRINDPSDAPPYAVLSVLIGLALIAAWLYGVIRSVRSGRGATAASKADATVRQGSVTPRDSRRAKRRSRRRR